VITTVTLNPMLDKTVDVARIIPGGIVRATRVGMVVGGKGVNVSRQLRHLGMETIATGFIGGEIGTILERLLDAESLGNAFVKIEGMTREGVTYRDETGTMTSVFEPPHVVAEADCARLLEQCELLGKESTWVVCCGSSPSAAADECYAAIIRSMRAKGVSTALDSYGAALRSGVGAIPDLVKVNRHEWEHTFGETLATEGAVVGALRTMLYRGVRTAILTDGERPCYAATGSSVWKAIPAGVDAVNPTGSGDSMLAAMLFGLHQQWEFDTLLAYGIAAGAANARVWDVAASKHADIEALVSHVHCEKIIT